MSTEFSGGCACGAIRYACTEAPLYMGNCHCRDCQQATGSAYFPAVLVKEEDFSLVRGTPNWYERVADAGHPIRRAFCPSCGSPLFLINGARPNGRVIYAGSLDDPSWFEPSRDIYVASAQPWDVLHAGLPKFDGMP
ncbi:MAG: GFA family protein [Gammaproteobacteria bacterium]|nr:GFA family protein [Gammaproteobacteria bacterium]